MKKTLIALAVMGAAAGVAHAQSNVTIYGVVDTGLIKETSSDVRMGGNVDSRIGFRGVEDLGSNMKATFELERRFDLNDGTQKSSDVLDATSPDALSTLGSGYLLNRSSWNYSDWAQGKSVDWIGAANVGLKGDAWGQVRLGRVNNLSVETFRMLDPFNQYGVGASLAKADVLRSEQLGNTVRYDSPSWSGFGFGATYTLGHNSKGDTNVFYDVLGNDGFAVNLKYDNGPILLLANYDRVVDSNKSYSWNAGGAYSFAGFKVSLGYQDSRFKLLENLNINSGKVKQQDWIVGLQYKTGPHTIGASYNRGKTKIDGSNLDGKANKYALGYTYGLSKRTSVYANVAYTDSDDGAGLIYNGNGSDRDSITGVQLGITHKF